MFQVKCKDVMQTYENEVTLKEIAKDYSHFFEHDILIATVTDMYGKNSVLSELNAKINKSCNIEFYDLTSEIGNKIYERGLIYLFIRAYYDILGNESQVRIEHMVDNGIYIASNISITDLIVDEIKSKMKEIVSKKIPFNKRTVYKEEAISYFEKVGFDDKLEGLKYISTDYITLYEFSHMFNYFNGQMPINSSVLKYFNLVKLCDTGFVLSKPSVYDANHVSDYNYHINLHNAFDNYLEYISNINVLNSYDLNEKILNNELNNLIYMDEVRHNIELSGVINKIFDKKEAKVVLLAGPSSSGKTTTCRNLNRLCNLYGIKAHQISLDDYYLDRHQMIKEANGEYDFEKLESLDIELFNRDLQKLLNGMGVNLPKYNFAKAKKEFDNKKTVLGNNDIIIIEGIHALNDKLTMSIDPKNKFKIYISPFTEINLDNHTMISSEDNRLLRRLVRDNNFRETSPSDTFKMWPKVRFGEDKYILEKGKNVDAIINSSLIYEFSILKVYAEPLLYAINPDDFGYHEARRLLSVLKRFLPAPSTVVPQSSVLREFIG
ncbi:MAG: hypothetical protein ACK5HL_04635 [Bacilli bacterium]